MCKVILSVDGEETRSFYVHKETTNEILRHHSINPDTKIVYINGRILSREKMKGLLPDSGNVFMVVKNKTVVRV